MAARITEPAAMALAIIIIVPATAAVAAVIVILVAATARGIAAVIIRLGPGASTRTVYIRRLLCMNMAVSFMETIPIPNVGIWQRNRNVNVPPKVGQNTVRKVYLLKIAHDNRQSHHQQLKYVGYLQIINENNYDIISNVLT